MDLLFSSLSLKRLTYLILVAITTYGLMFFTGYQEAYWLIWSAFILSLITSGDSFKRRIQTIVITGLTAGFIAFFAASLESPLLLALLLFLITSICIGIGNRHPELFFQALIINLFAILSACLNPQTYNLDRFEFICMGVMIAACLQIVFYPYFIRNELKPSLVISLRDLKKLSSEIFSCFLEPAYASNIYLFERRLHLKKTHFLNAMTRLRDITHLAETRLSDAEKATHEWWLGKLDAIFENMMDYSLLRTRVSDFATFVVCEKELSNISAEISRCFDAVIAHVKGKKFYPNTKQFNEYIEQMENHFHHVLQVAAPEPLVFLLFIDSLKAFSQKMEEMYTNDIPSSSRLS